MNVLTTECLQVDYSAHQDRFSIIVKNDWLSGGTTSFELKLAVQFSKHEFERVNIQQCGSEIEPINLLENYLLTTRSKILTTSVVLTSSEMNISNENYNRFMNVSRVESTIRTATREIVKRKNLEMRLTVFY